MKRKIDYTQIKLCRPKLHYITMALSLINHFVLEKEVSENERLQSSFRKRRKRQRSLVTPCDILLREGILSMTQRRYLYGSQSTKRRASECQQNAFYMIDLTIQTSFSFVRFFLIIQELRIPCMLLDGLVIFGLHNYESYLKKEQDAANQKLAHQADVRHEADKREKKARDAANRSEQKQQQRNMHNNTSKNANFAPSNNIQQPDKAKKMM